MKQLRYTKGSATLIETASGADDVMTGNSAGFGEDRGKPYIFEGELRSFTNGGIR